MPKSQSETDEEILSSTKASSDVILPETSSIIQKRHTRSVHPVDCKCDLHSETRYRPFSTVDEVKEKEERDWYQGE